MHTFPVGRSGRQYLLTWIVIVGMFLSGCARQKKDPDPPLPIPLPSVELSSIPSEKPSGTKKQTDPPPLLLPPSEELRSQLAKIRISKRRVQPEVEFSKPVTAGEGAMKGAGTGLARSVLVFPYMPMMIGLAPVFMDVESTLGVQKSQPEAKIKEFEQTFRTTIQELEFSQILRQYVADRIRTLQLSEITGPTDPAAVIVIEIVVGKIRLYQDFWSAPHTFAFAGSTRLLRASDGKELYSHAFTTTGQEFPIDVWLKMDAAKLRREVDRCCRELAESIVEEVFLLYLPEKNFMLYQSEKQKE